MWRTRRGNAIQWQLFLICSCGTRTSPHQFYVDLENEMLCDKQECQLLLFRFREISSGGNLLWKPVSTMEISCKLSKYLPCCCLFILIMYLIIQYFMIGTHLVYSLCPQFICMTDYEISFSLCKSVLGNISEKPTTEFSQFAFTHGRCKSTHQLIVRFFSTNSSLSNRWVVSNTLISITRMHSRSLNILHIQSKSPVFSE